jgi:predicted house-cleaning noncanonical NTP pyrophosphatase (MazG superfamily)
MYNFVKYRYMKKLIRDNYAEIILEKERMTIVTDPVEQFILYTQKIHEELSELHETAFNDIEEYADVLESLYAMADLQGIPRELIEIARLRKLEEKGGFKKCLVLSD